MFGNDLYTVTIETVNNFIKTSRVLFVPATNREIANFKVTQYLMDLNWPVVHQFRVDGKHWHISEPLREIDLLTLMSSSGAVRIGKDIDVPLERYVPATPEDSLAFKAEDDIDPDLDDPCSDCLYEYEACAGCFYFFEGFPL